MKLILAMYELMQLGVLHVLNADAFIWAKSDEAMREAKRELGCVCRECGAITPPSESAEAPSRSGRTMGEA